MSTALRRLDLTMPSMLDGCFPTNEPLLLPTTRAVSTLALVTRLLSQATAPILPPALPSPSMSTQRQQWTSSVCWLLAPSLPPRRRSLPSLLTLRRKRLPARRHDASCLLPSTRWQPLLPSLPTQRHDASRLLLSTRWQPLLPLLPTRRQSLIPRWQCRRRTIFLPPMVHVMVTTMRQGGLCWR